MVTQEQFDEIWKQAEAQYKSQAGAPPFPKAGTARVQPAQGAVSSTTWCRTQIIKQKAAEMGVSVTDAAFQARIKQIVQQVGGQKKLDKLLKQQDVT